METGYRVQVFSLILNISVSLLGSIQSASILLSQTSKVRILHSAEEDNLSPFDLKIACLRQSIKINNNKHACEINVYVYKYIYICYNVVSNKETFHCEQLFGILGGIVRSRINSLLELS